MEVIEPNDSIQPMPAEEPAEEPSPPTQVEEPEAPPAPKKKKLSEDRLEKLAKARARASEIAKQKRERKAKPVFDEPVVVVEQSESDQDTFEAPPGIIFVRRKRAKKPEPVQEPSMSPEMAVLYHSMFGSRNF